MPLDALALSRLSPLDMRARVSPRSCPPAPPSSKDERAVRARFARTPPPPSPRPRPALSWLAAPSPASPCITRPHPHTILMPKARLPSARPCYSQSKQRSRSTSATDPLASAASKMSRRLVAARLGCTATSASLAATSSRMHRWASRTPSKQAWLMKKM